MEYPVDAQRVAKGLRKIGRRNEEMNDQKPEPSNSTADAQSSLNVELCAEAMNLYKPPFHYECGYILDSTHKVVADDGEICRVRGWGRIQKQPNAAALQDKVGELIAQAMTDYWQAHNA